MRVLRVCLYIVIAVLLMVRAASSQNYRGEASAIAERIDPVDFSRLRFLTFAFGREGPMDAPLTTPPVVGRDYFLEADVFGIESAANIRFELIDLSGRPLKTLTMWKGSDASSDSEFYGFVTVPNQPFRAVASGASRTGGAFRAVLETLFQPVASGPPDQPIMPPGVTPAQSNQLQGMINAYRQELQNRSTRAAADHPNGVIPLARAVASRIAYEPLTSASGATIGVRLRYTIQFPTRATITAIPLVFPVYSQPGWRGVVEMKPLRGTVTPAPQTPGAVSLQDVIVYRSPATYEAGIYTFSVDMVPDFVFQGVQSRRFCIHEQKFSNAAWNALIGDQAPIPYAISISDTESHAQIPTFFPQRTFREGFVSDGAFDCGTTPNIRF